MPFNHKGEFIRSGSPAAPQPGAQPRPAPQPIPATWLENLMRRRNLIQALKILGWVALAAVVISFLVTFWVWILIAIFLVSAAQS